MLADGLAPTEKRLVDFAMVSTTLKKRVLITGANGLLGSAITTLFRDKEWEVFAITRGDELKVVGVTHLVKDLLLPNSGVEIVEATRPHIVINCAADQSNFSLYKPELDGKSLDQISKDLLRVNLIAPLEILTTAVKFGCKVAINISSVESLHAKAGHSLYGASKAALESLTRSAALELAPMRVLGLRLGLIHREGIEEDWLEGVTSWNSNSPLGRMGNPGEIARAIYSLISDDFQWATGTILDLDGGMNASPAW